MEKTLEGKEKTGLKLYNTATGKKEDFRPLNDMKVGMYVCGVTVYDVCHIGHARSAVVFDVIRRYLRFKGYGVKFVKNFTDIDDKIINRARQEEIPWYDVARKYTLRYYDDMRRLGVADADVEPRATEHIEEIIRMVKGLVEKGHAYVVDGDVYFSVESFPGYGKLSGRRLEDMQAGARVEVDARKKNPMDFALWKKSSKEGEPAWDSPWGPGRPGWHIECSAMTLRHLGETLDIHAGGADLIFPHHENELTQSEAYTGKQFVRYWLHNGFITVDKEKMSKSLGNFFTIEEILDKYSPEAVRLFLLQTHYRSPIEFSNENIEEAEHSLEHFYQSMKRLEDFFLSQGKEGADAGKKIPKGLEEAVSSFMGALTDAMDDDFNTALAIGHVFELVKEINRFLDQRPSGGEAVRLLEQARELIGQASGVLNLFGRTPEQWQEMLIGVKRITVDEREIERLIEERRKARAGRDWKRADAIRAELEQKGIILEDGKDSTGWRVKA
ncbi:MAG: cysteine--tRNA ligase [Nitrospiraceae bacterium]|nr:cysteine--tRNA ligase [Nitrospiraceae bacterium]